MNLLNYINEVAKLTEKRIISYLNNKKNINKTLKKSMIYSVKAGGKRLRPVLIALSYEISGGKKEDIIDAMCAMEMIHTYSLIHDDLPIMDNDDLRRGKPTNHKVFGEDIALLAGDALLTDAFEIFLSGNKKINYKNKVKAGQTLAYYAGGSGMVSGQTQDIEFENFNNKKNEIFLKKNLNYIHTHKTADMITSCLKIGSFLSGDEKNLKNFYILGQKIGLCFQIVDDILDVIGDKKKLGKSGSDFKNKKLTFVSLYGLEEAKNKADKLYNESLNIHKKLKGNKEKLLLLKDLITFILRREK